MRFKADCQSIGWRAEARNFTLQPSILAFMTSLLRTAFLIGVVLSQGWISASAQIPKSLPSPGRPLGKASPSPAAEAETSTLKELKERLAAAQSELNQIIGASSDPAGANAGGTGMSEESLEQREYLSQIVRAYTREIASLGNLGSEQQRSAELDREAATWKVAGTSRFASPPPYSIRMVDELRESLQSIQQYCQTVTFTTALLNNGLVDNRNNSEQFGAKLRLISEQIEQSAKDPAEEARLTSQRDKIQLALRSCNAVREMLATEHKLWSAKDSNLARQSDLIRRQIGVAAAKMQFTQADLNKINAAAAIQSRKLDKELQRAIAETQPAQKALADARLNLLNAQQAVADPGTAQQELAAKLSQLKELVEVRRIQAETAAFREEQLNQLQQFGGLDVAAWQHRFNAFGSDPKKAQEARQKLGSTLDRARILQQYYQEQSSLNSRQLTDLEDYVRNSTTATPANLKTAQDKLDSFRLRDESYKRVLQSLEKLERQVQRWNQELEDSLSKKTDAKMRVAGWYAGLSEFLKSSWNHEFYKVVDPGFEGGLRPITVGKVVTALCILLVGYFICRLLALEMQRFLTKRVHMESNMAAIIRGWMMFFLTLGLVMIAMAWVKIPLTAFAFLGGALAIGLGFGTQNLLKNFISGIMLLVEQPLRLGDIVEVGSSRGRVVNIGIRSSVIRNKDGIETLIPNSSFLENNVVNWTYSNPQVRFKIRVGVTFNSSSREVAEILSKVVEEHGLVLKNPKPQVLLDEFAENGMVFFVYFWLEPLKSDAASISSDLRFMIERQLTEAGIQLN